MPKGTKTPDWLKMAEVLLKDLPQEVADHALNHFHMSFVNQGFTDISFIPWVKRLDDLTFGFNHPIMDKTGALKGSLKIKQATMKVIEIAAGENVPYAAIHNNGGTIKIRITDKMRRFFWFVYKSLTQHYAHGANPPEHILKWKLMAITKKDHITIHVPKRQYIGHSEKLLKDVDQLIANKMVTAFKEGSKQ